RKFWKEAHRRILGITALIFLNSPAVPLDKQVNIFRYSNQEITWMPSEEADRIAVLQGTLDLIVLRTLQTMGPQHAYAIATRLQQVSEDLLHLNQGTLYPALVRLEQQGRIKGAWGKTDS